MSDQDKCKLVDECYSNMNTTVWNHLIDMLGEPGGVGQEISYHAVRKTLVKLIIENLREEYGYGNN